MIDDVDHCAKAKALREIREEIISGQSLASGKFGDDTLQFAKADLPRLDREIAYHEAECAIVSGKKPRGRRRAFTAGHRY